MNNRETDYSEQLQERYQQDLFPQKLGIKLEKIRAGYALVSMEVKPDMHNFNGVTHGGALFTLGDTAFGLASNTRGTALAMHISVNYVKATVSGDRLTAEAEEEHLTNSTGVYRITVSRGDETVALLRGTVFRKK
jgi:acyl-CoA thioesterase